MDNVTHSLLGAALATVALPTTVTPSRQRLFLAAGILASNAPDLDLLYVGIMSPPLGYLLHHRGHTHTLAGLLGLGALFGLAGLVVPAVRRMTTGADRVRLALLIAVSLACHVLLDACNSYGVHALYPIDAGWYYGDSLFIIEPWLWLLLAAALPWHAMSRLAGRGLLALVALFGVALGFNGVVPVGSLAALAVAGVTIAWGMRGMARQKRAGVALGLSVLFVAGMFGLAHVARGDAYAELAPRVRGKIVDVVLSPNPGAPLCWAVIGVEHHPQAGEFALHRGTLSLLPAWQAPEACATHRLLNKPITQDSGAGSNGGSSGRGSDSGSRRVAWSDEIREPLQSLRALHQHNCQARAWLQFGRAPFVRNGALVDLRFENGGRRNFTALPLDAAEDAAGCPPYMTPWGTPRADFLQLQPAP